MAGRRWPMVIGGLLATGAVIGAASALMRRRRSGRTWEEYGSTRSTADTSMLDTAKSAMDAGVHKASSAAEAVRDRSSDLIGGSAKSSTNDRMAGAAPGEHKQQRDDMYGRTTASPTSTSATNSRP